MRIAALVWVGALLGSGGVALASETKRIGDRELVPALSGKWPALRTRLKKVSDPRERGEVLLAAAKLARAENDAELAAWLVALGTRSLLSDPEVPALPRGLAGLDALPPDHPARSSLSVTLANRILRAEVGTNAEAAAQVIERLLESTRKEEGRLTPAERRAVGALLEARHQRVEAEAQWTALLREAPASPEGLSLARERPERVATLPLADRVARLEALVAANRSALAIPEALALRASGTLDGAVGCRLSLLLGKAHRLERNYHQAMEELDGYGERCPEPKAGRLEARWLRASATSIAEGDPAVPLYEAFVRENASDPRVDDALFFIADLHLIAGRNEKAARLLERILVEHPEGNFVLKSAWRLARRHLLEDRPTRALPALERYERLARKKKSTFGIARSRYFRAHALLSEKAPGPVAVRRKRAVRVLRSVVESGPFTFYGSLARGLLREQAPAVAAKVEARLLTVPAPPAAFAGAKVSPAYLSRPEIRVARRLLALGLSPEAGEVLSRIDRRSLSSGEVLVTAALLELSGAVREAQLLLRIRGRSALGKRPTARNLWVWQVAYPRAFRPMIEAACAPVAVPPDLVQAIIREESALDPGARSWAGAVGLAQLMPLTAADTARRMGLPEPVTVEALLDPELNLRVSCRYLSDLRQQVGAQLPLMIAAYNGGGRTLQAWQEERGELPLPLFLESMGYAETRRYTRRVLKTLAIYRFLYAERPADRLFLLNAPAREPAP